MTNFTPANLRETFDKADKALHGSPEIIEENEILLSLKQESLFRLIAELSLFSEKIVTDKDFDGLKVDFVNVVNNLLDKAGNLKSYEPIKANQIYKRFSRLPEINVPRGF